MNLYNRYIMRATGEKKFQATSVAEIITFATFDFFTGKDRFTGSETTIQDFTNEFTHDWKSLSEEEKNTIMEQYCNKVQLAMNIRL